MFTHSHASLFCCSAPLRCKIHFFCPFRTFYLTYILTMGSINAIKDGLTPETYSVPFQAQKLFEEGIIQNSLISKAIPAEAQKYAAKVRYVGSDAPSIPINWRFAESISALKGLEATVLNVLLARKYGIEPQEVVINT